MAAAPAQHSPSPLPRSRKAAMVVQLLLREGDDLPLSDLPDDVQMRLTKELGALNIIDKATLESVADEFAQELSNVALTPPGSMEAALKSLDGRISQSASARLREEAAGGSGSDPWVLICELEPEEILPMANAESPEVVAIVLSKLETAKAAKLLGLIPGDQARRIAYAISKTNGIRPDAIARIGAGLAKHYCGAAIPAFSETAEERIGSILNSSSAAIRNRLLEGLLSEDPDFGEGVRKAIFTFEDIPARLEPVDVPKVLRDIEQDDLITSLAFSIAAGGGAAASAEHILGNISTRMAENMREEMTERGSVKRIDGEAAQTAVINAIRSAGDAGTIILIEEGEEE